MITFDEAEASDATRLERVLRRAAGPEHADSRGDPGPGGGRIGAVVLSPYIQPGTVNATPYNHYSLLRSVEDIFGLGHLGYAGPARPEGVRERRLRLPRAPCPGAGVPAGLAQAEPRSARPARAATRAGGSARRRRWKPSTTVAVLWAIACR